MYDDRRFPDRRYYRWQGVWNVHLLVCAFCGKIQRRKEKSGKPADYIIHDLLELKEDSVVVQIDMRALGDL